jgi:methionyl-tRNA formyltransferase
VLAGADIVPGAVLEIPSVGAINGHYGLLPRYRGMNVTEWSIYHDDPVGVSVHYVDTGIDTGPVIAREPIVVQRCESLEDLRLKHQQTCARLLANACVRIRDEGIDGKSQRRSDGKQYYRMHPALRTMVESKLANGTYRWIDAPRNQLDKKVETWS